MSVKVKLFSCFTKASARNEKKLKKKIIWVIRLLKSWIKKNTYFFENSKIIEMYYFGEEISRILQFPEVLLSFRPLL